MSEKSFEIEYYSSVIKNEEILILLFTNKFKYTADLTMR